VHHHTPHAQLERTEFKNFLCNHPGTNQVINIDDIPVFV
jgi:hypothetical protein